MVCFKFANMKKWFVFGLLFFTSLLGFAQHNLNLQTVFTPEKNDIPESYKTEKSFSNTKGLTEYAQQTSEFLTQQGYLSHRSRLEKSNDSLYLLYIDLEKPVRYAKISLKNLSDESLQILEI